MTWTGPDAYLLSSRDLPEVFYNRGGLLSCTSVGTQTESLEEGFRALRTRPAIMVFDSCSKAARALTRSGYGRMDTMYVMAATGGTESDEDAEAEPEVSAEEWSEAYLRAFYGEQGLMPAILKIVKPLMSDDATTLLQERQDGRVAGTLALYRTDRLMGVYCVGTIPELRGRGVAGALLSRARKIAASEERTVLLQTLESDGVVPFYLKRGFKVVYRKTLMMKKGY